MKIIINILMTSLCLLASNTIICQTTTYRCGAMQSQGITTKCDIDIDIEESYITFLTIDQDVKRQIQYDVVNYRNGKTYVTDGVETHNFTINRKTGKKKGFEYTKELYFTTQSGALVVYYLNKEQ